MWLPEISMHDVELLVVMFGKFSNFVFFLNDTIVFRIGDLVGKTNFRIANILSLDLVMGL